MKQLFTLFLLILSSCSINDTKTIEIIKQNTNEIDAIKKVLISQQECWNNGDIDGFMDGYWKSKKLIFTSAKHKAAYGWENTLKRYKESYPDKYRMGEFRFEILNLELTFRTTASLYGKWELIRKNDHPNGFFWLDLEKFDEDWLITKDSTISFKNYL